MTEKPNQSIENLITFAPSEFIGDHRLFSQALEYQMELNNSSFKDYMSARRKAGEYVQKLDRIVIQDRLLHEPATIKGGGLIVPFVETNTQTGTQSIGPGSIKIDSDNPVDSQAWSGQFMGFTAYIKPEEYSDTFQAHIAYQVSFAYINSPSFNGTLMVYGDVSESSLEFMKDKTKKDASEASSRLLSIDDEHTVSVVSKIDELMIGDERYNRNNLRRVSRLFRRHIDNNPHVSEQHFDALLDLIGARLELYEGRLFEISADYSSQLRSDQTYYIGHAIDGQVAIKALSLSPHFWRDDSGWKFNQNKMSPCIVIEQRVEDGQNILVNIPLERISKLLPAQT